MRLNGELESRVDVRTAELSAALRSRDEFLAMLGHELRNPLAPIRTASEVIRALTPDDSPIAASSRILYRQVGHLTRLVDDLLDVARVTQGQFQMELQETSLADIIAMAVEQSRPIIDERMHSLSVTLPARADGGLGIGLTLAKRIIDMHGGTIVARSAGLDKGTEFTVRLPLVNTAAPRAGGAAAALVVEPVKSACNILLVDDNDDARLTMLTLLEIHGHDVACAHDGRSALALASTVEPTIVILDIGLPDIDGYEVARQLRARPNGDQLKLIALTGYGQANDLADAAAAGFDTHILKPANIEDVLAKIAGFMAH